MRYKIILPNCIIIINLSEIVGSCQFFVRVVSNNLNNSLTTMTTKIFVDGTMIALHCLKTSNGGGSKNSSSKLEEVPEGRRSMMNTK